jgi:ferredoxin, 2Fe-2S
MPRLTIVTRTGAESDVIVQNGRSLMDAIYNAGIKDLLAICGGSCSCSTCHVYIDPAFATRLPPMHEDENDMLQIANRRTADSRLSCQIPVTDSLDGMRLTITPQD